MSFAADHRHAPIALWQIAQRVITELFDLFGAPEHIAEQHTFTHEPYKLILTWLRAAEALVRRLLLIEASHYAKPNTRPLLYPQRKRAAKLIGFDADHPEKWRVSFRCLSSPARGGSVEARSAETKGDVATNRALSLSKGGADTRVRFHSAWPIAERMEALLRVYNNPTPYARRLARRLHATPHRAEALTGYPAGAPDLIGWEEFRETSEPAEQAVKRFNSS